MTDEYLESRGVHTASGKALSRELTQMSRENGWPWHAVLLDDAAYFVDQIADIERDAADKMGRADGDGEDQR